GLLLGGSELVTPPSQPAAGDESGVLEQPPTRIGVRVALDEHRRILAGLPASRAHRLGRAYDVADLARRVHASPHRRRPPVPEPQPNAGTGGQPGAGPEAGSQIPHGLGARGEFGKQAGVKADKTQYGLRPGEGPRVEEAQR